LPSLVTDVTVMPLPLSLFHQYRVVLDRYPQLLAAPFGDRSVGEEFEREHVLPVHLEGRLQRLPRRQRRPDVVAGVADRVKAVDDVRFRVVVRLVEFDDAVTGSSQRRVDGLHGGVGADAGLDRLLEHVARRDRLVERGLNALGRRGFAGLQHVRDALDVGAEVHQPHAPVDHHHVARLDEARRGCGDDAVGAGDVDRRHVELRAEPALEQAILEPPRDILERGLSGGDHFVRERALRELDGDARSFAEGDNLRGDAARAELADHALGADQP
jgi:hypothetical protein